MDAFNVAFRVPNLLRDLFAEGAMTAAFVPTFTRTLHSAGRDAAWRLGNLVINALLVVTGVLVVLGILFAEPITRLIAATDLDARSGLSASAHPLPPVRGRRGQARADDAADADHAAVPDDRSPSRSR